VAKCNACDRTKLIRAVKENNLLRVLQLVQLGAPLELRGSSGWTTLQFACYRGHERIAKLLLDGKYEGLGAETDAINMHGETPLILANFVGHEGVMRLLLAHGAKVGTRTKARHTTLYWATTQSHATCEALLRARDATS